MKACFIGHKTIKKSEVLISSLKETVLTLIHKGVTTFLFGSNSEFNNLAWEILTKLKEEYPHVKRIYVRSTQQPLEKSYEEYLLKFYEETYCPSKIEKAGKYSYVERNYEMIDKCEYCITYLNNTVLKDSKSGTKIAYDYAQRKSLKIFICSIFPINIFSNFSKKMVLLREFKGDILLPTTIQLSIGFPFIAKCFFISQTN